MICVNEATEELLMFLFKVVSLLLVIKKGERFYYILICYTALKADKAIVCHPEQDEGESKDFFPLKGLIFSLNYESNGEVTTGALYPTALILSKSFHVAQLVLAIRAHYRLVSGIA